MSESSGRYQSRILSFVSHHTQKLTDRAETWLRHLKITTIWSTQILLYPIYAVFQTIRLGGRQFRQAVQQVWQKLPIVSPQPQLGSHSDAPIQQVLADLREMGLPVQLPAALALVDDNHPSLSEATPKPDLARSTRWIHKSLAWFRKSVSGLGIPLIWVSKSDELATSLIAPLASVSLAPQDFLGSALDLVIAASPPSSPLLQGIASLCEDRRLVLVTTGNQILDSLTVEQQRRLQRQITLALANYRYAWRRAITSHQGSLPLPRDRSASLPPVRLWAQLMAWMQVGPVAGAINLFQESALAQRSEADWFQPTVTLREFHLSAVSPSQLSAVADWPAVIRQLPPLSELPILIQAALRYFFGSPFTLLVPAQSTVAVRSATRVAAPLPLNAAVPLAANDLTAAQFAIAYIPNHTIDPWLTQSDLFGESASSHSSPAKLSTTLQLALPPALSGRLPRSLKQWMQGSVVLQLREGAIVPRRAKRLRSQSSRSSATPAAHPPYSSAAPSPHRMVTEAHAGATVSSHPSQPLTRSPSATPVNPILGLDVDFDWIDTPATPVGYVKHPLTQLLIWFDNGMVWLENRLIDLWNWWVRLLR